MKFSLVVSLCHFCEVHGPVSVMSTQTMSHKAYEKLQKKLEENLENVIKKETFCEGCSDFEKCDPGFVSLDTSNEKTVVYVSSLKVQGEELNKSVDQICARSISCEQYPGQQAGVMYADEGGLSTFSYKFFLKDFHSRGFKRSYVVNVICTDKFLLFNSWMYLTDQLEVVVARMRADAENFFNCEHNHHSSAIRSKSPTKTSKEGIGRTTQRGYQGKQTRSIVEMTDNAEVFEYLHVSFVVLMKGLCTRLVLASDAFMSRPQEREASSAASKLVGSSAVSSHSLGVANKREDSLAEDSGMQVFSHPRVLMKVLGDQNFSDLLHHLLVGHQVMLRAKEQSIIASIIKCLKIFLPRQSEHLITDFTAEYSPEQRDKLLIGMPLLPLLPSSLPPCLILDVSGVHMLKKTCGVEKCWLYKRHKPEIEELLLRYYMITVEKLPSPTEDVSLLESIKTVLLNASLENSLADSCLHSLKQEWIDKAKVYKACMKRDRQSEEKVLQVIAARRKDRQLLQHWAAHYCP